MKRIFRRLHLWLSIPFGLIITLICLSGAALVFETEILEYCYPERYFVEKTGERALPLGELVESVAQTLPDSVFVTGANISSDPHRAYEIYLSKPRRASVYVDQYTGQVKPRFEGPDFFTVMFRLHRWLLDSMKPDGGIFWGKMIVGTSTLLLVFVLITGILISVPKTIKALRNRLKICVSKGWARFWHDLHVAGGIYASVILLVLALTGLTWSFSWYRTGFFKVFGVEEQQRSHGKRRDLQVPLYTSWQHVHDQLSMSNPEHKEISILEASAHVTHHRMGNQSGSDRYTFEPSTGEITTTNLYKDQHRSDKIRGWIYSVHVGSWGGLPTKILTFIAAFIGGFLPLTGYYLWIRRAVRKRKRREKSLH